MQDKTAHGSVTSYVTGFVLSVIVTVAAYLAVVNDVLTSQTLMIVIVGLAIVQLLVQLVFFLHLGQESKPRWKSIVFLFMLVVLVILVFGSLWIMNNLNYHMRATTETDSFIIEDEGISD